MKHLFILNAFAGKKSSVEELKSKISELSLDGDCIVEITKGAGDAKCIAHDYVSSTDDFVRVYACGGDGTANEAMSGMVGLKNCALGVVPVGTGNDFVKSFAFSIDHFKDLQKMVNGSTVTIDLLKCGEHYAMNSISVGYDCAVAKQAQKIKRFPLMTGPAAYKAALLYCLFSKRVHTFEVYADDKKVELPDGYNTQMMCVVANGKFYGGGFKATPYAEFCDGNIDFLSVPTISLLQFAQLLGPFIKGEHIGHEKAQFIVHKKCKKIQFKDNSSVDISFDGEIFNTKDPTITVVPSAMKIIVPQTEVGIGEIECKSREEANAY